MTEVQDSPADNALKGYLVGEKYFEVFYKYQTINEYSLDALEKGYCYFSEFEQLNDPFDPFITMIASRSKDELLTQLVEMGIKVFCLTPDNNNPLMWAHYGNSGAGMCVGYAVFTGNPRLVNPVQYVKKIPESLSYLEMMLLKQDTWAHEREWRAVLGINEQKVEDLFHPVSVHLGPRCSHHNALRVEKVLPKTINEFELKSPIIQDGLFYYGDYKVNDILNEYKALPRLSDLYKMAD